VGRVVPQSCFLLQGQQDIAAEYLEELAIVVPSCVKSPCFFPWTENEVLIMKFYIRKSENPLSARKPITGNNYITLDVKYRKLILHHDDTYGKHYGKISFLDILAEAKSWNRDTASPTHSLLLPACLAS